MELAGESRADAETVGSAIVDYVDNYVEKWLEWPERPLIST